jgi:hypothetical protein
MMREVRADRRTFQSTLRTVAQIGRRIEHSLDANNAILRGIARNLDHGSTGKSGNGRSR